MVIVPLNWGESIYLKSKLSGTEKWQVNTYSYLLLYKDAADSFHTEVVLLLPDSNYVKGNSTKFSGLILVQDWQGQPLKAFRYTGNKIERLTLRKGQASAREAVLLFRY